MFLIPQSPISVYGTLTSCKVSRQSICDLVICMNSGVLRANGHCVYLHEYPLLGRSHICFCHDMLSLSYNG